MMILTAIAIAMILVGAVGLILCIIAGILWFIVIAIYS